MAARRHHPTGLSDSGLADSGLVILVLVVANLANHLLGWSAIWLGPVVAAGLLLVARVRGLSWSELGLARDRVRAGLVWGGGAVLVVATAYLVVALVAASRPVLVDERYDATVGQALVTAFLVIPVGTVIYEELVFRSVLWAFLSRHLSPGAVLVTTSALFGVWHVFPALGYGAHNEGVGAAADTLGAYAALAVVLGTVLLTGAGGLVLGWLRRRSGSVLASIGLHWATNSLGVLFGLLARHLGS